jgi:DNA-binding response OmpR family regulator
MTKYRLLVVDDDTVLVIFLRDILEGKGYVVHTAHDGLEGFELAKKVKPNLILLDVMMPKMDGYEVCRRLRDDPGTAQIPILMLTARGQVVDRTAGLKIGADDYLAKPCDKKELEARVEALLRRVHFRFPLKPADEVVAASRPADSDIAARSRQLRNYDQTDA